MKPTLLLLALAVAVGAPFGAAAADQAKDAKPATPPVVQKVKPKKAAKRKQPTSAFAAYIKKHYRESGIITAGPSPLYIINSVAISRSGAADLSQVIIHTGFRR